MRALNMEFARISKMKTSSYEVLHIFKVDESFVLGL